MVRSQRKTSITSPNPEENDVAAAFKKTPKTRRNSNDSTDEFEFRDDEDTPQHTPTSTSKPKGLRASGRENKMLIAKNGLPQIQQMFPHVAAINFNKSIPNSVVRCVLCDEVYKTEHRANHYRMHGTSSKFPCDKDMWATLDHLDKMRRNLTAEYVFDCRTLPIVMTMENFEGYRKIVNTMKQNGIAVSNEDFLTQMEDTIKSMGQFRTPLLQQQMFTPYAMSQPPFYSQQQVPYPASAYNQAMDRPSTSQQPVMYNDFQDLDQTSEHYSTPHLQRRPQRGQFRNTLETFERDEQDRFQDNMDSMYDGPNVRSDPTRIRDPLYPSLIPQKLQKPQHQQQHDQISINPETPLVSIHSETNLPPHKIFFKKIEMYDLLSIQLDDPDRYEDTSRKSTKEPLRVMQMKGFYRKLKITQHPLLQEYEKFLVQEYTIRTLGRTDDDLEERGVEISGHKGGCQMYSQYIQKLALIILRARNRSSETLTLDDLIFSGPIVKLFVQYLQNEIKHGGATIVQYSKAMLDCLEWVQKQKDMRMGPSTDRGEALADSILKCRTLVGDAKPMSAMQREADETMGLREPKEMLRYGLSVAFVNHSIFARMSKFLSDQLRNPEFYPSSSQYNIYTGYVMLLLMVTNTSRNELMYKLRNHNMTINRLQSEKCGDTYYMVGYYASPKQGANAKARTKLFRGYFCMDQPSMNAVRLYEDVRNRRIQELGKDNKCKQGSSHFFRTYDQKPLSQQTSKQLLTAVQKGTKFLGHINCNGVRHKTASLEFWCTKFLKGGQETAILAGHSKQTQLLTYDKEASKKVAKAFRILQKIAKTDIKELGTAEASGLFKNIVLPNVFVEDVGLVVVENESVFDEEDRIEDAEQESTDEESEPEELSSVADDIADLEEEELVPNALEQQFLEEELNIENQPKSSRRQSIPDPYLPISMVQQEEYAPSTSAYVPQQELLIDFGQGEAHDNVFEQDAHDLFIDVVTYVAPLAYPNLSIVDIPLPPIQPAIETIPTAPPQEGQQPVEHEHDNTEAVIVPPVPVRGQDNERKRPANKSLSPLHAAPPQPTVLLPPAPPSPGPQLNIDDMSDPAVINYHIKIHNNKDCVDLPKTSATRDNNYNEFIIRRKQSKYIQNWPWVAVYYIPKFGGAGLFAKNDIAKGSIVLDYFGWSMEQKMFEDMTMNCSEERKKLIDDYVMYAKLSIKTETVVQAHMPVFQGRIILGRYINHTSKESHTNVEPIKEEIKAGNDVKVYMLFRARRNIKAGEQLLYSYGKEYSTEPWYKDSCPCLKCSPTYLPDKNADIPFIINGDNEDPFKIQSNQSTQRVEHTSMSVLLELVNRANICGIHLGDPSKSWKDAIIRCMNLVGGGQPSQVRQAPTCNNVLQEALQQASHSAFVAGHPSVVIVRNRDKDKQPMMVLCGSVSSGRRFGNLVVFNQKHSQIHELTEMDPKNLKNQVSVVETFRHCSLTHIKNNSKEWNYLINNKAVTLNDVKAFRDALLTK